MTEVISIHCGPNQLEAIAALIGHIEAGNLTLIDIGANEKAFPVDIFDGEAMTLHTIIAAHNGSLDAARALQERLLPSHHWYITRRPESFFASVSADGAWRLEASASGTGNPARAWLLAILRAYREIL